MKLLDGITVRPSGEAAIVLELGDDIDPRVHDAVLRLDHSVQAAVDDGLLPGVEELVPSYRSLLVRLDPTRTTPHEVLRALGELPLREGRNHVRRHEVSVSFADDDADDLPEVARRLDLPADEIVALLCGAELRLYLHGFAPGFAYFGGVPDVLGLPRRSTPRAPVRPGAVLLAAGQLALCPSPMPTGWWVVGHTSAVLFDPATPPHVPHAPGDTVRLTRSDPT